MLLQHPNRWYFAWTAVALVLLSVGTLPAQDEPAPPDAAAAPAADGDAPATGDEETPPLREQTIYVPFEKLREVFEKEGRGVFLPYDKFQELWRAAREKTAPAERPEPPVAALIAQAESEATVEKDVVSVTARLKIDILAEGWHEVPLRLGGAAIRSATIDGQPARVVPGNGGYTLLVKNEGQTPVSVELLLQYVKAYTKSPGQNSVSFEAPQAPVNRWKIRIPESGVKVNIFPLIAAAEVPAAEPDAGGVDPPAPDGADDGAAGPAAAAETVVLAFVGAAPTVRIDWTPKSEGATGLAALATVQAEQEVRIEEGVVRTRARLTYDISRAKLDRLKIEVPAEENQKVVGVFDPNVRQWDVKTEGDQQTIDVQLFEPVQGQQRLAIDLERFSDDLLADDLVIPAVKALDVGRQQGIVVVALAADLQAEAIRRGGLVQVDRSELPATLARDAWAFAYRYAALPFDLALKAEKVLPKIRTEELVEAYIEPEQLTLSLLAQYTIERAGVFQFQLQVPAGFEVRTVRGHQVGDGKPAAVDPHQVFEPDQTRLDVNLSQRAIGRVGLLVELVRRLDDPNLLRPTGQESQITLDLPRVDPASIERCSGRMVVYKPDSLRVVPAEQTGLSDAVSLNEVYQTMPSVREGRFPATQPALTFAYTEQPASLVLDVERRKPHVTARQLLVAHIDPGVVKYEATFFYDILYSGIKSLRIDVPADLAADITKITNNLQKSEFDPAADGGPPAAEGDVAWRFTGETELIGQVKLELAWERKLAGELAVGTPQQVPLPRLTPMEVDREWGQIVIAKAETIDVHPTGEPQGLQMIDPQQNLMAGAQEDDAALAFEFYGAWQLAIEATRYKLTPVKRTSIERAVVRMAATLDGDLIVQALYRLRSARQRLAVRLPDPKKVSFDSQPLWINGQPAALEQGDGDDYFVPLVGQNPDEPLLLDLRYTMRGGPADLQLPTFPDDPPAAVQKVFLCVYLPQRLTLLGAGGPWTDEMTWHWQGFVTPVPRTATAEGASLRNQTGDYNLSEDEALVRWVAEGVSVSGNPYDGLPADGTLLVYSTLRPADPPAGALRLTTLNRNWLNFLVFVAIAAVGVVMLARPLREKFALVMALAIAIILLGVFVPTFAVQVLGGAFLVAVIIVVLLWLGALVFWETRPGRSLLAAILRGRQPGDVVVRPVTPSPSPPAPAAIGEAPTEPAKAESPGDESAGDESAGEESNEDADRPETGGSSDDEAAQPEGGRTDA